MTEIKYSDGQEIEQRIYRLLTSANCLDSNEPIAREYYNEWPIRYHLCPERANLIRHLNFQGLAVLEIGAGMGAVSRYLAETASNLTVVEGTQQSGVHPFGTGHDGLLLNIGV